MSATPWGAQDPAGRLEMDPVGSGIIGVTVGVGYPYEQLAPLAATCFSEHTGLPVVILGAKELKASALPHPAALRLGVFEFVPSARVVYFDADWLCLADWAPQDLPETGQLVACRDFILTEEWPRQCYDFDSAGFLAEPDNIPDQSGPDVLRQDYIREIRAFCALSLAHRRWVNTGLLVMSREHHDNWLRTALRLYLGPVGHHGLYYEQPALLKAMEICALAVRLLPRKFNVLAAYERKWPSSVVGLHIKLKRHEQFLSGVSAGTICTPHHVRAYFQA